MFIQVNLKKFKNLISIQLGPTKTDLLKNIFLKSSVFTLGLTMDPFLSHSDMSLYLGRDYNLMYGHNISV